VAQKKTPKVLIAKPGLDGHDRGARVLVLGLRAEGFEVVYSGLRQSPEDIVNKAIKEKADVIGLSILSGAHKTLLPEVAKLAKEKIPAALVIGGGNIPEADVPFLKEKGIKAIFSSGTSVKDIAEYIRANVK
jgi:methylmalonyl-CoA mutase, C-terminal domain